MCGIAGFVSSEGNLKGRGAGSVLERMCKVIAHRGPDDQGLMIGDFVALGMRRLSIIDLAGGRQPISNEDGSATIVFNGEIYNYRELRNLLLTRGHTFKTSSDTEVVLRAYEEFGPACVDHFRGMFALALWDARRTELFLARDRVGKKPLYYALTPQGTFVFGSELKSLLEHPEVRREVNFEALDAYLSFGYVPDPMTVFNNVHKLGPGHHLRLVDGRISIRQYWDFRYEPVEGRREADCVAELHALLDEAVRVRLVSDVPLGAFLSGGIDSSTVVSLMSRHMTQPVKTFSIGFHEDSYSELKYARLAAKHFGTDHHEFIVTPDICRIVDELAWHFDEPFVDSSAIPTYMVSKLAREHVTVALTGDGGDELFAGYTRYATDRRRSGFARVPGALRRGLIQPLSRKLPHGARGRNYLYNVSLDPLDRYMDSLSVFTKLNKHLLYTNDFRKQLRGRNGADKLFHDHARQVHTGSALDPLLYLDSKTYLPGDILTKLDRMSMAVSLEARAPLLDHKLIDFVASIPASMKLRGLESKYIFKRVAQDLVPAEILDRPKQGFGVPIQEWINKQLRERMHDTLTEPRTRQRGYIEQRYVNRLLDEHERHRRDHSHALWALMMLELWHRTFIDGTVSETPARGEAGVLALAHA